VKDPGGIGISTAASDQSEPAVAFDGTNSVLNLSISLCGGKETNRDSLSKGD